jgi:hypothetical protein
MKPIASSAGGTQHCQWCAGLCCGKLLLFIPEQKNAVNNPLIKPEKKFFFFKGFVVPCIFIHSNKTPN